MDQAQVVLVRSAAMHEMDMPAGLDAIARAGAGVNNIPLDKCAQAGVVVFNTPGANANAVKELVLTGMLVATRNVIEAANWVQTIKNEEGVAALVEKGKKLLTDGNKTYIDAKIDSEKIMKKVYD